MTKAGAAKPAVIIQRDEYAKVERYGELAYTLRDLLFQVMYFTSSSVLVWYLWLVRPFIKRTAHYYTARSSFVWPADDRHQHINSRTFASSFRRTTEKHLSYSLGPAFLRHLLTAFARRNGGGKGQGLHVLSPNEVLNFVDQADADSREMQASYTAATAKAVYALQSQLVFQSRFTMPEAHLKTSVEYVNLCQILKVNLGLHSRFRGLQQAVVQDIVNMEPVVAYIAGTGSGKSLAFLLPACCLGFGQQVVVTPLVALWIDITNQCAVKTFRQSTSRGNLRYEVKELSAPFSIPLLTSYVRREEGKETSFSTAKRAVLVATVAFVAGFGAPDYLITFAQGMGRGGRNGQTCIARIVFGRGIPSFLGKLEDRNAQWVMQQILDCNYCLRIPIDLYLDGDSKRTAAYDGSYAASTLTPSKTGLPVDWACTASLRKRDRPLSLVSSSLLARRDEVGRAAAKAARVDRALEYNQQQFINRAWEGAKLVYEQLAATGAMWTNNCIKCFVDGQAYDHLKGSCNCLIGPMVRYYKDNHIGGKLGTSMCYSCAMLQDLCQCTYNRPVVDTWVCLWEYSLKAKDIWLWRIREESNSTLDGAKEADFVSYFRQVLRFTYRYPYFITADKSKALLGSLL
ncbi:hypothetical protein K504DRAFT_465667 [Pleomassaria siparia CBS 279.74]|uniref:DEAD/DEAH-box helicase domain-containing protein n=1 Tax=Pleomassaria siparia CBS 279.74 TaxID=1314801 RepID=A0A6G1JPV8_9PLEO|nr:hypothetical protein K504DRAFT_465667 [Pleomassaria siparia CBS 279.74]